MNDNIINENNKEYLQDIIQLERDIYLDSLKSKSYINDTIKNLKKYKPNDLVNANKIVKYKIPFKLRVKNFFNKLLNTFK